MASSVHVTGLRELVRAANEIDKAAGRQLNKQLRDTVGKDFVEDVRERLGSVGFKHPTGRIAGSIKPTVRGASLTVRSSPPLKPGPRSRMGYAAVYEYGYGRRRAFLDPTLDAWLESGKLLEEFEDYLDWIDENFRW